MKSAVLGYLLILLGVVMSLTAAKAEQPIPIRAFRVGSSSFPPDLMWHTKAIIDSTGTGQAG